MPYRFVFIDADMTLFDFDRAEEKALYGAMAHFGLPCDKESFLCYHKINAALWKLHEQGSISQNELRTQRFSRLFSALGITGIEAEKFAVVYLEKLSLCTDVLEGAPLLLSALRGKVRLFLATNGIAAVQRKRLSASVLRDYFDDVFISQELGCQKPMREYFTAAFTRISNFDPAQAIILGDSLSSDMRGGRNAGISTCWYNPQRQLCSAPDLCDYEIFSLAEFVPIVLGDA